MYQPYISYANTLHELDDESLYNLFLTIKNQDTYGSNIFTGVPEIDTLILHELDDQTLYHIAQLNRYGYELCINDIILRKRINNFIVNQPEFKRLEKIFKKARFRNKVYIHIRYNYKNVNELTEQDIALLLPEATEIEIYRNDIAYKIPYDDILYSIQTIVEALGHVFHTRKINARQGLASEIEYDI